MYRAGASRSTRAGGQPRRRHAGRRAPPPRRRCSPRPRPAAGAARRAPADFYAAKGAARGAARRRRRSSWQAEPGARPFLHPGRAGVVLAGDERELGWIGELHPLVARAWDLDGRRGASSSTSTRSPRRRRGPSRLPRRDQLPGGAPGHRRGGARGRERRRGRARPCARAAASCSPAREVFDVYEGEQVGEGNRRWRCGSSSARPTARSPTRRWPSGAARDRGARWPRSEGGSVPEHASPSSEPRASAARCARGIVQRHPSLELTAVTARTRRRAGATTSSTRATACG